MQVEEPASVSCAGLRPELMESYVRFAKRAFGRHAYQADPLHLRWLYEENPAGGGMQKDLIVGVVRDEVVACAHKMRLPWRMAGQRVEVPALHNLMVEPAHRQGTGGMLILGAMGRDAHVMVPGVGPGLSPAYKRLGARAVETAWYRWLLDPVGGAVRMGGGRLGIHPQPWRLHRLWQANLLVPGLRFGLTASTSQCGELASRLGGAEGVASPAWTAELVAWRFFHPIGPQHLFVRDDRDRFGALVSLGRHRGARVARLIETWADDASVLRSALRRLRAALYLLGGDVLLGFSANSRLTSLLGEIGAPRLADPIETLIYHRRRGANPGPSQFQGGAGDFGFEAR